MKETKKAMVTKKSNNNTRKENETMKVSWTTKQGNTSTRELTKGRALIRTQNGYKEVDVFAIKGYDEVVIQQVNKGYRLILVGAGRYVMKKNGGEYKTLKSACEYGIRHALKVKRDNLKLFEGFAKELAELVAANTEKKPVKSTKTATKKTTKTATKKVDKKAKATKKVEKKSQPDFVGKTYKVNTKTWKKEEVKGYGEGFAEALRAGFAF